MGPPVSVSVVIPTYNRSEFLVQAVQSVLNQTRSALEIIVVDDASSDATRDVLMQIQDARLRYLRHEVNLGGAAARNTGIEAARGNYVAFLDSDDQWLPAKIETQWERIREYDLSEPVVSYGRLLILDGYRNEVRPRVAKLPDQGCLDYFFLADGLMQSSTLMLPTWLAREVRFDASLRCHQDTDFCARLEAYGSRFVFVEAVGACLRADQRPDRISLSSDYHIYLDWYQRLGRHKLSERGRRAFLAKSVSPAMARSGRRIGALKYVFAGSFSRAISTKEFLALLVKCSLPQSMQQHIRRLVGAFSRRGRI